MIPILAEISGISGNLQVTLAALGAAIGVGLIGAKAAEAVGRNPGASVPVLVQSIIAMALAEGVLFITIFLGK
jgi:F-type H+-transporting ATPase subunit c